MFFLIIASGLLAGCTDPGGTGDNNDVVGTSDPAATASLTPSLTVNGASASTTASLTGPTTTSVPTGTEAKVEPGDYDVTFGDKSMASAASDNLPLVLDENTGWYWVVPKVTQPVGEGAKATASGVGNLFIEGTWTCDTNNGAEPTPGKIVYTGGTRIALPGVGNVDISVMHISLDEDGIIKDGDLLSDTFLEVSSSGSMAGSYDADCWAGDKDPR